MHAGVMSTSLAAAGLEQTFERAAEIGADGLVVAYVAENDAKLLAKDGHPAVLKRLAADHGLSIPALNLLWLCERPSLITQGSARDPAVRSITQALNVAAEIGAKAVIVPFYGKNTIELEDELTQAAESLLSAVDTATETGVAIGIESTLNFAQYEFLLEYLGNTDQAGACLDIGTAASRKLDVPTGIRTLGAASITQVHVKDVRTAEGQPPNFDVALGEGDVDFRAIAQALRAVGYDGWLGLETPPGPDAIAVARANLEFMRRELAAPAND